MESNRQRAKRSGYAGLAAVAVALGLTELFAGLSKNVPSAMSAIGGIVIDLSPSWLKNFAISVFGTQDKVVLGISVFAVCMLVGYFLGKRSVNHIYPILIGFVLQPSSPPATKAPRNTSHGGAPDITASTRRPA
jgi:hypothetical protein